MADETKQKIQAEWHVSEWDNPPGHATVGYVESGHLVRLNVHQKATPEEFEAEVMRCWPHDTFKIIHANGRAPHPQHALVGKPNPVQNFKRPEPPKAADTNTGPTSLPQL